jgi:outer membrane PBP1 activator LpoA protein
VIDIERAQMRVLFPALPAAVIASLVLCACANAPTPSSKIAAAPGSALKYSDYTCAQLSTEMESLVRHELVLIKAHEQRVKSSNAQELILGVGQGDGPEATALANVRGDQQSAQKAMDAKKCPAWKPPAM